MKNLRLIVLLAVMSFGSSTFGQTNDTTDTWQKRLKKHITYLSSEELKGRYTGSKGEKLAAAYIIKEFKKNGITTTAGNFSTQKYLQPFSYNSKMHGATLKVKGANVVGFVDNKAAYTIVLGAHYDHLGVGDPMHSAYRGEPAVHNGADDNASGVAAVIELGKMLKVSQFKKYNYLLIAFSGEELGLFGSKYFTEHPLVPIEKMNFMLNFDMVGRLDSTSKSLVISGTGTSSAWDTALYKKSIRTLLNIKKTEGGIGPSDHSSFYMKNVPALHFFTGQHQDYHKPSDDEFKINYSGLEEVVQYAFVLVAQLNARDKLLFTPTKQDTSETPKFSVTLGVMPDYTFDGEGMRIDGVTEGKPASKAGLAKGDVVVQLGEEVIKDMTTYMKALSKFKKGDSTVVKIKRNKESLEMKITF
jgi:Zn-dependent M28 family amino/carboxypeptidase